MKSHSKKIIRHIDLKGRDWEYNGATYHVLEVENDGTRIITDKRIFNFGTNEERDYFLASLRATEVPHASPPAKYGSNNKVSIVADTNSDDIFSKMLGELEADFYKMKEDPGYVKIAKQRANQVNTMTNMIKTKIQLERLNRR